MLWNISFILTIRKNAEHFWKTTTIYNLTYGCDRVAMVCSSFQYLVLLYQEGLSGHRIVPYLSRTNTLPWKTVNHTGLPWYNCPCLWQLLWRNKKHKEFWWEASWKIDIWKTKIKAFNIWLLWPLKTLCPVFQNLKSGESAMEANMMWKCTPVVILIFHVSSIK
jgi:hypothetical protein